MSNFWKELKKPIFALAPLADVTDPAFRKLIAKYGKPDVMWTEFVSADGLFMGGKDALIKDLAFSSGERPIVAQFFTNDPDHMRRAVALASELGFDGVDINMGCPDRSIERQGAGAAHMKDPEHAIAIIEAAKEGAKEVAGEGEPIPISVKTRLGYNRDELETWLPKLLSVHPAVVTIHARTRKEMSKVPARWERITEAVRIRDEQESDTLIFGNGDILSLKEAEEKVKETGCDGIMIGKGIFGNPWFFNRKVTKEDLDTATILRTMVEHTKLFEEMLPHKNFAIMKKHYKAYANGFDGAKELRMKLMDANDAAKVEQITETFIRTL